MMRAGLAALLAAVVPSGAPAQTAEDALPYYDPLANLELLALSQVERDARGVTVTELGEIDVPGGAVMAMDPLTFLEPAPLALKLMPGSYPVYLWFDKADPTRPAMAELRISGCRPTRWMNARVEGMTGLSDIFAGDLGYPVDAGTGAFADLAVLEAAGALDEGGEEHYERWAQPIINALSDYTVPGRIMGENGNRYAVFSSGWGDGIYASYWGFDDTECPCALVTDFGVLYNGWPDPLDGTPRAASHAMKRLPPIVYGNQAACPAS